MNTKKYNEWRAHIKKQLNGPGKPENRGKCLLLSPHTPSVNKRIKNLLGRFELSHVVRLLSLRAPFPLSARGATERPSEQREGRRAATETKRRANNPQVAVDISA